MGNELVRTPQVDQYYVKFHDEAEESYFSRILPFILHSELKLFVIAFVNEFIKKNPGHGSFLVEGKYDLES